MTEIKQYRPEESRYYICLDIDNKEYWSKELHAPLKRANIIVEMIRLKYTQDDEFALNANMNVPEPTEKHKAEYAEYQAFRNNVKEQLDSLKEQIEEINTKYEESIKPVEEHEVTEEVNSDNTEVVE